MRTRTRTSRRLTRRRRREGAVPMSQEDHFLQAIYQDPADDAVRLIYADWLEENGRPERAEFIRLQCEQARLPKADPRKPELGARAVQLLEQHAEEWLRPLRPWVRRGTFRR